MKDMLLQRFGTGNWVYCLKQLNGKSPADGKAVMADGSQLMKDRIARWKVGDNEHVNSGARSSEAYPVVDGQIYGVRAELNPFMISEYAEKGVELHRKGVDLMVEDVRIDGKLLRDLILKTADADAKKPLHLRKAFRLTKQESYSVPSLKLGEEEVAEVPVWTARGKRLAERYGKILPKYNIDSVNVNLPPRNVGNIIRTFWLNRLGRYGRSDFDCVGRSLGDDDGSVFGGFVSAEGTREKISEPKVRGYTPAQSKRYTAIIDNVMSGKAGTGKLRTVRDFFGH